MKKKLSKEQSGKPWQTSLFKNHPLGTTTPWTWHWVCYKARFCLQHCSPCRYATSFTAVPVQFTNLWKVLGYLLYGKPHARAWMSCRKQVELISWMSKWRLEITANKTHFFIFDEKHFGAHDEKWAVWKDNEPSPRNRSFSILAWYLTQIQKASGASFKMSMVSQAKSWCQDRTMTFFSNNWNNQSNPFTFLKKSQSFYTYSNKQEKSTGLPLAEKSIHRSPKIRVQQLFLLFF